MGREVKRVAIDFDWPLHKIWNGYVNPYYKKCEKCDGSGATMASRRLDDLVNLLMLSGDDAKRGKAHPYFYNAPLHQTCGELCGEDMSELTEALAGRSSSCMGHDCIDNWSARSKILKVAGVSEDWGKCKACNGEGLSSEYQKRYNNWERVEPPTGKGYQIWETVTEGSPVSPVFADPEKLADWMVQNDDSITRNTTKEQWLIFIFKTGYAPTFIYDNNGFRTGVEAVQGGE
jgi:hypothetical protein